MCLCSVTADSATPRTVALLPSTSVHENIEARILEWVAISFPRGSSQPRDGTRVSCVSCFGRQILYHCTTSESHILNILKMKYVSMYDSVYIYIGLMSGWFISYQANQWLQQGQAYRQFQLSPKIKRIG